MAPSPPSGTADPYAQASSLYTQGQFAQAFAALAPLIQPGPCGPDALDTLNLAAICLRKMHRQDEAQAFLQQVIAADPGHVNAHFNLGNLLRDTGRLPQAEAAYQRVLEIQPDHARALHSLGHLLFDLERFDESLAAYERAIALDPGQASVHEGRGHALLRLLRLQQAEAAYQHALALDPHNARTHFNLGVLFHQSQRVEQAEAAYRHAIAIDPGLTDALCNLGALLNDAGLLDEGIGCYRQALARSPGDMALHSTLAYTAAFEAEDGRTVLEDCQRWAARFEAPLHAAWPVHGNDRNPVRRLRIGYVSPDFRLHCQSLFTVPVFAHHDHGPFEFFFYSSVEAPDATTQHLMGFADVWRDVHALSDEQLAQQIREDGIDILVDLTMHMHNGRPLLFAHKPAPVQIAWLAYPGTTGLTAMDYRLTDPWLDPFGTDGQYTERSIRLPETFWCYDPLTDEPAINPLPALTNRRIRFGSLNNPFKFSDHTFRIWAGVLQQFPEARFAMLSSRATPHARLLQRMQAQGIDLQQIDFLPYQPRASYLRLYQSIDICLDTFPCNGHTTSLDAFWMGVPVVTRVGQTPMGRAGLSQLLNLGLGELAAFTDAAFIDTAVQLAQDLPRLSALRQGLRQRMERSPLMDGARFARHLEEIYRKTWQKWCNNS